MFRVGWPVIIAAWALGEEVNFLQRHPPLRPPFSGYSRTFFLWSLGFPRGEGQGEKNVRAHASSLAVYDEHVSRALCSSRRVLRQLGVVFKGGELRFWTVVTKKWYYDTKIEAMVFLKTLDRSFRNSWEVALTCICGIRDARAFSR